MSNLTPYDTGEVLEPKLWGDTAIDEPEDWGKVDFDNDSGTSVCQVRVVPDEITGGYMAHVYDYLTGATTVVAVGL